MQLKKLLVVIDPTSKDKQPSLDRASLVASRTGATLELLICDYNSALEDGFFTDRGAQQRAAPHCSASDWTGWKPWPHHCAKKAFKQPARCAGASLCMTRSSLTSRNPLLIWYSATPPPTAPCSACCSTTPAGS